MKAVNRPLFPLSAHLLPGGRMALRIFEPRYTRMVKEACSQGQGFVLCMLDAKGDKEKNEHIYARGTYAEVIDFTTLEDGLLGITVAGLYGVSIDNITTEQDGLRVGDCTPVDPWDCSISAEDIAPMTDKLTEVFDLYPEIASLYDRPSFSDPIWVLNRWLELLPVDADTKQEFLSQTDCRKVLNYLTELVR